ncbi:DUF6879 family protein [Streptomyces sp. NPDC002324]
MTLSGWHSSIFGEEFGRLFEISERTAFRPATLDVYDVEEERGEIARFLAGENMGRSGTTTHGCAR